MSSTRKTLAIYFPDLAGGGIERLCLHLVPAFSKAGYDVVFLLQRAAGDLFNSVPAGTEVVSMNASRTLTCLVPLIRFLRERQPDILFTGHGHNNVLAIWARALSGVKNTRVIVSQHNAASVKKLGVMKFNYLLLPLLERLFFGWANGIVAVSNGVAGDLAEVAGLKRERISVIYNPIVCDNFDAQMDVPVNHRWLSGNGFPPVILGVGRFVDQKDFATLITAFAKLLRTKDARLILLGEGPLRGKLKTQAQKLGIADKIDMPGFQQNPLPWMKRSALLAMSSRYEGFGNVLVEALACGTPVVSTDCSYGPSEILADGKYGSLVPVGDADALAKAMLAALENPLSPDLLRARGREFTVEKAAKEYVELFNQMAQS